LKSGKPRAEAILQVRVIPRSPRTRVDGTRGDAVLVRLAAPPVDGAANEALIAFLAEALDIPRRDIELVSGERSRDKRLRISGLDGPAVAARLGVR
jgi:uncharacterized protein (TIGR00251 family)